ncbi:MAG: hypothetical protein Kow0099_17980 [Candidatus Abyssubacteria bacterium]
MSKYILIVIALAIAIVAGVRFFFGEETPEERFLKSALQGDIEAVESALKSGIDPNVKDRRGRTALMIATNTGQYQMAKLLLNNGADPNVKNKQGVTPLMYAAQRGQTDIAKLLLAKGADVNARSDAGRTALSLAKEKAGNETMIEFLMMAGGKE